MGFKRPEVRILSPRLFPKPKGFGFFIKVAATLDTPPPMLYNGVVAGKLPAVV